MGDIVGTKIIGTELEGGVYQMVTVTAPISSADDAITLTAATHGITAITSLVSCVVTGGLDAAFTYVAASFSGLVITIKSLKATGAAADEFTLTAVSVTVIGTM